MTSPLQPTSVSKNTTATVTAHRSSDWGAFLTWLSCCAGGFQSLSYVRQRARSSCRRIRDTWGSFGVFIYSNLDVSISICEGVSRRGSSSMGRGLTERNREQQLHIRSDHSSLWRAPCKHLAPELCVTTGLETLNASWCIFSSYLHPHLPLCSFIIHLSNEVPDTTQWNRIFKGMRLLTLTWCVLHRVCRRKREIKTSISRKRCCWISSQWH